MADETDILTLGEARTAINMPAVDHDVELEVFVTGISHRIDDLCGPVVVRTVTDEVHDGGKSRVWLRETPVDSVTTVVEWVHTTSNSLTAESNTSKPASSFLLDSTGPYSYLWRRSGGADSNFSSGRRNVVITYEAGRYASTATVDAKFKLAAQSILRRTWKREQSSWAQSAGAISEFDNLEVGSLRFFKAVDPMIREFLTDDLLPPVGI